MLSTAVVVLLLLAVIASSASIGYCIAHAERDDERYRRDNHVP